MSDKEKGKAIDNEKLFERIAESAKALATGISSGSTTSGLSSLLSSTQKTAQQAHLDGHNVDWDTVFDEAATGSTASARRPVVERQAFRTNRLDPALTSEYEQFATTQVPLPSYDREDQQLRDGQAVVELLNHPDFNDIIHSTGSHPSEPSSHRLARTMQQSGDTTFLVNPETTPYLYNLMQTDGEALTLYLRNTTYTDDIWTLPAQVRSLVDEAKKEALNDQQPIALHRLQMLQGHLRQNNMQLSQQEMEDIWKSF